MKKEVIAIFDIGKTNKKILLFDQNLNLVSQHEDIFEESADEDGYSCDCGDKLEKWVKSTLKSLITCDTYKVVAVNFSTYGATMVYVGQNGNRLTPVYNYLRPMPEGCTDELYGTNGGVDEFSRVTASPALGMLNSGLQILWLKKYKPEIYSQVAHILHFPQYFTYLLTQQVVSEYTSIGCHTALWDFDKQCYHHWLQQEQIALPTPTANTKMFATAMYGENVFVGTGIHDSSAALAPYFYDGTEPFVLISTGTWCITMNPFNETPLTKAELEADCLCYLSVQQTPVKASRLFMGHIHDVNLKHIAAHFGVEPKAFEQMQWTNEEINHAPENATVFFCMNQNMNEADTTVDLNRFANFESAYKQMLIDLSCKCSEAIRMVIPDTKKVSKAYVTGGFSRNKGFMKLLSKHFNEMDFFTSQTDNASALGAAIMVYGAFGNNTLPELNLGLKKV